MGGMSRGARIQGAVRCARLAALAVVVSGCAGSPERQALAAEGGARQRIVVMAPAAAEMLAALGAIGRIVGVGDYVLQPASLAALPRVGAYHAPSVERILELDANLVITTASQAGAATHERLASLGVEVLALDTSTFEGVFAALQAVGRAVGREAEADALAADMHEQLAAIRDRTASLPLRRVLFVVGRDPLYVAGPGSHVDQMIELAGGANVLHDAPGPYPRVSFEAVLERMPEVIIDASDNRPAAPRGRIGGDWARWEFLPAVRARRVYWVDPDRLVIPGMRLPQMTLLMAKLIHPEAFGEPAADELVGPAS
jgi:iron complex transport system substrate-binding protein